MAERGANVLPFYRLFYGLERIIFGTVLYAAGRILVVVETLLMFRLSLSVRPFSRLVFESPGFC
ncbi:MAG: hypothetical protein E6X13_04410, partial [Corynebacterium sp.]|nr:hypothetical protein [Corynebacterium sp.]